MRGIAWRLYLGTGALATGAYYLLPGAGGAVLNVVVGASTVAAIAAGIRWHRPARRLAGLVCGIERAEGGRRRVLDFEPQATSALVRDGHFGLVAMQERVEMAGGRFQVDTHPGAGVVLRAMFRTTTAA